MRAGSAEMYNCVTESEYFVKQAQECTMKGDHFTAMIHLTRAIDICPENARAYTLLGNCQDSLDNARHAIDSYDQALKIDPGDAETWFVKGMCLKKIGHHTRAISCFKKCVDLNFR
jgi:tetratricopeptide (TPR) repeat protein